MFINSRNAPLFIVMTIFAVLALISTFLRCWVRARIVKSFRWDDWFMVIALLIFCWYTADVYVGIYHATGQHTSEVSPEHARTGYLMWWLNYVSYGLTITTARVSIGFFFLRVTVSKWHRYFLYFVLVCNVGAGLIFLGVVMGQCAPARFYWEKAFSGSEGHCIPMKAFVGLGYLYGSVCALIDFIYCIFPIPLVWKLDVSDKSKIALVFILGIAGIGGCAPLVRMAYLHTFYDPDFFYATVDIAVWSTVEPGLAITASNLATLKPLIKAIRSPLPSSWKSFPVIDVKDSYEMKSTQTSQPKTPVYQNHDAMDSRTPIKAAPRTDTPLSDASKVERGDSALSHVRTISVVDEAREEDLEQGRQSETLDVGTHAQNLLEWARLRREAMEKQNTRW